MNDLSKEINETIRERQRETSMRFQDEEGPSTSYQQQRRLEDHISPHITTMPNLFEEGEWYRNEERISMELETHETLSIYLEKYKSQSRPFRENLVGVP